MSVCCSNFPLCKHVHPDKSEAELKEAADFLGKKEVEVDGVKYKERDGHWMRITTGSNYTAPKKKRKKHKR